MNMRILFVLIQMIYCGAALAAVPYYNRFSFEEMKSFLDNIITPGELVFDVGANIGKKTELYLACGARVVCFEPQKQCCTVLKNKFKNNHNVVVEELGLSSSDGEAVLFMCDQADTIASCSADWVSKGRFAERSFQWKKRVTIKTATLDQMIQKYGIPCFCKIDVEGFEFNVISGLSKPIPCISFECNSEMMESTENCINRLAELGYNKFNFAIGERGFFAFQGWLPKGEFISAIKNLAAQKDKWEDIWGLWGDVYAQY